MSANHDKLKIQHGPGIWEDVEGGLHFSIPELLDAFGIADTPENRTEMERVAREVVLEHNPNAQIIERP